MVQLGGGVVPLPSQPKLTDWGVISVRRVQVAGGSCEPPLTNPCPPGPPPPAAGEPQHWRAVAHPTAGDTQGYWWAGLGGLCVCIHAWTPLSTCVYVCLSTHLSEVHTPPMLLWFINQCEMGLEVATHTRVPAAGGVCVSTGPLLGMYACLIVEWYVLPFNWAHQQTHFPINNSRQK